MNTNRFRLFTGNYARLRIAILGDFCLDRYMEIDPAKREVSIETGLPVHNVIQVRAQAGGAGTILNNVSALGVGTIYPIGFLGEDGEGFELERALTRTPGVRPDGIVHTALRRTFTYCKPLIITPGQTPVELNRLDSKNWTPTPQSVEGEVIGRLRLLADAVDAIIVLDQVDVADTGVVTKAVLGEIRRLSKLKPDLFVLADSRRGLGDFPPLVYKMNLAELGRLTGNPELSTLEGIKDAALSLAARTRRRVFVTIAERGIMGAEPDGLVEHRACLPLRGPIDIVGAGDAVSANLTCGISAGASLPEALELANAAASVVIHKLGTTGTASVAEIEGLLQPD